MGGETSRDSRRLKIILVVGAVIIGLALGFPKCVKWRTDRQARHEVERIVGKIRALSQQPLVFVKRYAAGGFPGPGGQRFGQKTDEIPGCYRVIQRDLILDHEIAFLRDRVNAIDELEGAAKRLPEGEETHILNEVRPMRDKWQVIVPSEITDDGVDWSEIGEKINMAMGVLAKNLENELRGQRGSAGGSGSYLHKMN